MHHCWVSPTWISWLNPSSNSKLKFNTWKNQSDCLKFRNQPIRLINTKVEVKSSLKSDCSQGHESSCPDMYIPDSQQLDSTGYDIREM
jgi:hypothetical protein